MAEEAVKEVVEGQEGAEGTGDAGDNGDGGAAWYENLGPDLKAHPSITKFKEPGSLAKSYVELEKMVGKDKIVVPTDKSKPEEWAAFYEKIGRPKEMGGYETPNIEIDESLKLKEHNLEAFKKKAHELGLTKKQFSEMYGFYHEMGQQDYNALLQNQTESKKTTETALRGQWGSAYDAKVDGAQKVINSFFKGKIDKSNQGAFTALANSKGFIEAMADIASKVGEDVIAGGPKHTMTPKEASTAMNEIIMDMKHPYHNNTHPEHKAAVDKVIALQQMASAGK